MLINASKVSRTVGQDHSHVCFEGVPYSRAKMGVSYGRTRTYLCMFRRCPVRSGKNRCPVRSGKIMFMYSSKVSRTVGQDHTHVCFEGVLYGRAKIGVPYGRTKT